MAPFMKTSNPTISIIDPKQKKVTASNLCSVTIPFISFIQKAAIKIIYEGFGNYLTEWVQQATKRNYHLIPEIQTAFMFFIISAEFQK